MGTVVFPYVFNGDCNGYCTGTVRGLWETQSMHSKHEAVHTCEGINELTKQDANRIVTKPKSEIPVANS